MTKKAAPVPAATGVRMTGLSTGLLPSTPQPSDRGFRGTSATSPPRPKIQCEAQEGKWECDLLNSN